MQRGRGHIEGVIEEGLQRGRGGAQPHSAKPKAAREARGARRRRAGCAPVPAAFAGRGRREGPEKMQGGGAGGLCKLCGKIKVTYCKRAALRVK